MRAMPFRGPYCGLLQMILLFAAAAGASAESWPEFRGPGGQGHSSEQKLPVRWDASTHVDWKKRIEGKGWSSPVIYNDRIYLTTALAAADGDESDQSLRVLCLDVKTGNSIWNIEVFKWEATENTNIHA